VAAPSSSGGIANGRVTGTSEIGDEAGLLQPDNPPSAATAARARAADQVRTDGSRRRGAAMSAPCHMTGP